MLRVRLIKNRVTLKILKNTPPDVYHKNPKEHFEILFTVHDVFYDKMIKNPRKEDVLQNNGFIGSFGEENKLKRSPSQEQPKPFIHMKHRKHQDHRNLEEIHLDVSHVFIDDVERRQ